MTDNPHAKDAEAAGRYILSGLRPSSRRITPLDVPTIVWLATWAGHWGRLALRKEEQ